MRQRIGALLGAVLALFLAASPALAEPQFTEISWGWGGQALRDAWVPLTVTLNTDQTLDGDLVVTFTGDVDRYREIRLPAQLVAGQEKRLTMPVLYGTGRPTVAFEAGGKRYGETSVSVRTLQPYEGALVGVISADAGAARYLDLVDLGDPAGAPGGPGPVPTTGGSFNLRRHRLAVTDLPERPELLESFSLLLLARPGGSLTQGQVSALTAWVEAGGLLVVAGGPEAQANWASLPSGWQPDLGPLGPAAERLTAHLEGQGEAALPTQLNALAPFADELEPGVRLQPMGSGAIVALTFDPTLEPLASWVGAEAYWGQLLSRVALEAPASRLLAGERMYGGRWSPYTDAAGQMPSFQLPSQSVLVGLFVAYLLLVAPMNYLVLKKLDRREWGWVTIPVISVAFTAVFILISGPSRLAGTFTHPVTVTADGRTAAYVGFYTTRQADLKINLPPESGGLVKPNQEFSAALHGAVLQLGNQPQIQFRGASAWEVQGVALSLPTTLGGGLEVAGQLDGSQGVSLVVRNLSGQVVRDAYLVSGDLGQPLGDLQPGEERTVTLGSPTSYDTRIGLDNYIWQEVQSDLRAKRQLLRGYAMEQGPSLAQPGQLQLSALVLGFLDEAPVASLPQAGKVTGGSHLLVGRANLALDPKGAIPPGLLTFRAASLNKVLRTDQGGELQAEPGEHELILPLGSLLTDLAGREATLHWQGYGTVTYLGLVGPDHEWELTAFGGPELLGLDWTDYVDEFGNLHLKFRNNDWLHMPLPSLSFEGGGL